MKAWSERGDDGRSKREICDVKWDDRGARIKRKGGDVRCPRSFVDASPVLFASDRNRNMSTLDGTPDSASTYKGHHIPYQGYHRGTTFGPAPGTLPSAALRARQECRCEVTSHIEDGID